MENNKVKMVSLGYKIQRGINKDFKFSGLQVDRKSIVKILIGLQNRSNFLKKQ